MLALQLFGGNVGKTDEKKGGNVLSLVELSKPKNTQVRENKPCQASIPQKKSSEEKE
jgi:hypothetical protein